MHIAARAQIFLTTLLIGSVLASLSEPKHHHSSRHPHQGSHQRLASSGDLQARAPGVLRPGQLCDPSITAGPQSCTVGRCDPVAACLTDGTCGHHCEYILLGDSGCINDGECGLGGCVNGVCVKVTVGGSCHLNHNCDTGLCDEGGHCVAAVSSGNPNLPRMQWDPSHICISGADCVSGECSDSISPLRVCRGGGSICEDVSRCAKLRLGQACATNSMLCSRGACVDGACAYVGINASCQYNSQCHSNSCLYGKCIALAGGDVCSFGSDCASGACSPSNNAAVPNTCRKNSGGGICRDGRDCISGSCPSTCAAPAGDSCSTSPECASFKCRNGICAKAAAGQACGLATHCISETCASAPDQMQCTTWGCYVPMICSQSLRGGACYTDLDCHDKSWCQTNSTTAASGTCVAGSRPTAPATSTTKTRSPTSTGAPTATGSNRPLDSLCTTNTQCSSGYCRKLLLSDKITRASTGACDTKREKGGKCYQSGGCVSGNCDKINGVCL